MLMRNPTRIEFKVEDAQEYFKMREKQKRSGPAPESLSRWDSGISGGGASPTESQSGAQRDGFGFSSRSTFDAPSESLSARMRSHLNLAAEQAHAVDMVTEEEAATQPPARQQSQSRQARQQTRSPPTYQREVEQLMVLGFRPEDARRALEETGGDVEAAADRLLL
eukprot:TRINITY_DN78937_c0_g1_i1.p1 TRINITY_DN78937_c0_g1~~TRINITY_DN78937_c0_g1_i1.p1  ORF type:complete len:166 (+),score=28.84 TRINITY_DN78937_c0_g1_i1:52-549(+)